MDDLDVILQAIKEDEQKGKRSGTFWYAAQNGKLLFRAQKNYATLNYYAILGTIFTSFSTTSGGTTLIYDTVDAHTGTYLAYNQYPNGSSYTAFSGSGLISFAYNTSGGNPGKVTGTLQMAAGTDTSTTTTNATYNLKSQVGSLTAISSIFISTSNVTLVCAFPTGAFGATGTTTIGELGIFIGNSSSNPVMTNRIAVADGANLGSGGGTPVIVNNTLPITFTAVIY